MIVPLPPTPLPQWVVDSHGLHVDGRQTPAEPLDAATVLLVRPGPEGRPELYFLRRHSSMQFAADMAVFPGGRVDPADFDEEAPWAGPSASAWAARLNCDEATARALLCAAVRETFEETGVLIAGPSPDEIVTGLDSPDWEEDRAALESRTLSMAGLLRRRELLLRTDLLGVWGAWLTPVFFPRRYRTWFFVAVLPDRQEPRDVSSESDSVLWLTADEALDRADDGQLPMMSPTYLSCLDLSAFSTVEEVLAEGAARSASMFLQEVEPAGASFELSLPESLRPLVEARHPPRGA